MPFLLAVTLLTMLMPAQALAQAPFAARGIPPELRPWIPWVLDGVGEARCPKIGSDPQCYWPGELSLDVGDRGASFRLRVAVTADSDLPLPGSAEHWPERVQVGGVPALVLTKNDAPRLRLGPGTQEITGRFVWDGTPESLPVPPSIALVELRLRGQNVPQTRRIKQDSVWLGRSERADSGEPERAEVEVSRRLCDGVPFRVDSRIVLRVSGRARELALDQALLPGTRPVELSSSIPVRLDEHGALFAQVRAGEHEVTLNAILPKPPDELVRPKGSVPWPEQETWAWSPAPGVRQVHVTGLAGIDAGRTNLPKEWSSLSAYVAESGSILRFQTLQRGQPAAPPNNVKLDRTLWLDTDGAGFTVRDSLEGEMHRDWRLDLTTGELGHVRFGKEDQLITVGPSGKRGVEVRSGKLELVAEWRSAGSIGSTLPAAGWSENLQQSSVNLELPPGWRYLGAWGVDHCRVPDDELPGSWHPLGLYQAGSGEGSLYGALYVVAAALATGFLLGWHWGVVALVALGLSREYELAPYAVWGLLLALLALLRRLRPGAPRWIVGLLAMGSALGLLSSAFEFVTLKLGTVAYPDAPYERYLHHGWIRAFGAVGGESVVPKKGRDDFAGRGAHAELFPHPADNPAPATDRKKQPLPRLDPSAIVQTGPGVPEGLGSSRLLSWDGPVEKGATFRILVLNRWQNALLGLVHAASIVALVYALMAALVRALAAGARDGPSSKGGTARLPVNALLLHGVLAIGVLGTLLTEARAARADMPTETALTELRERLTRGSDGDGSCTSVPTLALTARGTSLTLELEVHTDKPAAHRLPGPASSWVPRTVTVDRRPSSALVLKEDGHLYLRLDPGIHRVLLEGPVTTQDLTLTVGSQARRVTVVAEGWEVDGVRDGRIDALVHLARKAASDEAAATATGAAAERARTPLPPWLEVERTLEIGVVWRIRTEVKRISRDQEPLAIRFPLLPGEEVTESTLVAERGEVRLSLARDQQALGFTSVLRPTPAITLVAAQGQPWSELWTLQCSPVWHCESAGVTPSQHESDGVFRPQFRPWPGERLKLEFTRPAAAPGVSTTVDSVHLSLQGDARTALLDVFLRTSTGSIQTLTLPPNAQVTSVTVDGEAQPVRWVDGRLSVVLKPGRHAISVSFRPAAPEGFLLTAPRVRVGPAVNASTGIGIPKGRFALYVGGTGDRRSMVLWWGVVVALCLGGIGLSFLPGSPIRRRQWVALALGFTQTPWMHLLPVVGWFFLVSWRDRRSSPRGWRKNALQLGILAVTLVAGKVLLATLHGALIESPSLFVVPHESGSWVGSAADRVLADAWLPEPWVLTAPDWIWRLAHMIWALWLVRFLCKTGRFAWAAFTRDGLWGASGSPASVAPGPEPATEKARPDRATAAGEATAETNQD